MKHHVALLVLVVGSGIAANRLLACDCLPVSSTSGLAEAESVFFGKVLSLEEVTLEVRGTLQPYFRVTLAPQAIWKGPLVEVLAVLTHQEGTACGADFGAAQDWLVFAYRLDAGLEVSSCSVYTGAAAARVTAELGEPIWTAEQGKAFTRGDANADGRVNLSDGVFSLSFLFRGGPAPACLDAADVDDSGSLELTDAVFLLEFLFRNGEAPPRPGAAACGTDPTADVLGCNAYPAACP